MSRVIINFYKQVAIKVIDTRKIKEDYVRQNLHREAKIMSQLRHPNIVRLYETLKVRFLNLKSKSTNRFLGPVNIYSPFSFDQF